MFEDGIKHSNSRRALIRSVFYPGQMGTGQKCPMWETFCPTLDICAPKPRRRWVPRLYPVPYCPSAFLFRYNVKYERACLKLNLRPFKDGIQYSNSSRTLFSGVLDIKHILVQRRNNAPLSQTCTVGEHSPTLASRGANLRPRKLDENLSKHGLGARRVALLAPRATFREYCSPLNYVSAINKLFQEVFS